MSLIRARRLQRLKRTLDIIAYGSTVIDAAIMLLVLLSLSGVIAGANVILAEVNLVLTLVIGLFIVTGCAFVLTLKYDRIAKWWSVTSQRSVALAGKIRTRVAAPRRYDYRLSSASQLLVKVVAKQAGYLFKFLYFFRRLRSE